MSIIRLILILSFLYNFAFAANLFDFFSSGENEQDQDIESINKNIDINKDLKSQDFAASQRAKNSFEIIPYVTYSYSRLNIDYDNSTNKTDILDSKFNFGVSINTSITYLFGTKFGYMFNFNYEQYEFDNDKYKGSYSSDISGKQLKISPILFYEVNLQNDLALYLSYGYGLSKLDLSGKNNYDEPVNIDSYSFYHTYKLEILYKDFVIDLYHERINFNEDSMDIKLNETHLSIGYLLSF